MLIYSANLLTFKKMFVSKRNLLRFFTFFFILGCFTRCKRDTGTVDFGNYPIAVGKLITTKCTTNGCHNETSKQGAAGLSLETWNSVFEGYDAGAAVVPYRPDFSSFCYVINTFPDLGIIVKPTMPYNKPALNRDEVVLLNNWIAQGAPSRTGQVKFADNPSRRKFYVSNQGTDVVTVFDEETLLPMRYINVGESAATEYPQMVKVSPDGKYWYVVFSAGTVVQRYNTSDDSFAGQVEIGSGNWNSISISNDSKDAYVVDWSPVGQIAHVDLQTMTMAGPVWTGSKVFDYPHGSAVNKTNDTLYVTGLSGNYIYKVAIANPTAPTRVSLDGNPIITNQSLNVNSITFSPDFSKYIVTCQRTNEVRILNTSNDSLLAVIPVGIYPQEVRISKSTSYAFVSCQQDTINFPGSTGSIAVIDYKNNSLVRHVFTGFQPHGLVADDVKKIVCVANRNLTAKGPAPHHQAFTGGRIGYVTFIDMTTLELVQNANGRERRIEVAVDPYSVDAR